MYIDIRTLTAVIIINNKYFLYIKLEFLVTRGLICGCKIRYNKKSDINAST